VDLSKFKTSDWLKVGGGVAMLIAYFLTWWKIDFPGAPGANGSDYFFTGTVPWLLILAVAIITFLSAANIAKLPRTVPWHLIFLAASALSFLLVLIRFFSDGFDDDFGEVDTTRGAGLFIALLATIVVTIGSVLGFKESGGDLNDLKDVNKLKSSFGGSGGSGGSMGGGTPPPPPPYSGGGAPPPPPPPSS